MARPRSESSLVIGTTLKQRFHLEKELGRGGMGAVYKAVDQTLQRSVAIKVLKDLSGEEVGRRLRLEAQILARLVHENIVRLYDFDEQDGTFYFIMEEVDGASLFQRWKHVRIPERLAILSQVADALDYAHHQGVIHRDIKPGNVLLTKSDQAKLSDFGLSVFSDATQEIGVARGTPLYMSPEQAKGLRLDHRTDLYALGILIYECCTGTTPFVGNAMAVMSQHVNAKPEPARSRNPEIAPGLNDLIMALIAKEPESRPGSGRAVGDYLREVATENRWSSASGADAAEATAAAAMVAPRPADSTGRSSAGSSGSGARPTHFSQAPGVVGPPTLDPGGKAGPMARQMIDQVITDPIQLTPDERFLAGHYLAYLLGGSRRRGFWLRRPLDPLNADRARLILAMTWLALREPDEAAFATAARLLDERPDIRPLLSPVVLMKYLRSREQPNRRKRFRAIRQKLQETSTYAARHMVDERGLLNPGLMPQTIDDLRKIAPADAEVDDQLVERWNRLTEIWRGAPEFRESVLRYATVGAADDPASVELWPEVVYPLIERARWQRRLRSKYEVFWDGFTGVVQAPAPGVKLDRAMARSVPEQVAEQIDEDLEAFEDVADLAELMEEPAAHPAEEKTLNVRVNANSLREIAAVDPRADAGLIPLSEPDPLRFSHGELRELWKEALGNLKSGNAKGGHQHVPVGPYRLAVVASIRGHKAGTVAVQGMPNKQVEMLVPSFAGGAASRPVLAVWVYSNKSLAITYLDVRGLQRYILWDASNNQQTNFVDAADLNHNLFQRNLEVPEQLDRVLTKKFRPSNSV